MELIEKLKMAGIEKGLCQPWQAKLEKECSTKRLVDLYIKGIDFCIKNEYPTLDLLRSNFKGLCEPHGVFIDDVAVSTSNAPDVVLNGCCEADLTYNGFSVSRIYVRHTSRIIITVSDHAYVTIDAFDNAHLEIKTVGSSARIYVTIYGNAQAECMGDGIRVKHMKRDSY